MQHTEFSNLSLFQLGDEILVGERKYWN